ncbi:MAG: DNA alkylation repair protein [Calditrichia bacterium]
MLREYSKTDSQWVINFVKSHEKTLSNLSKREALKVVERQKDEK